MTSNPERTPQELSPFAKIVTASPEMRNIFRYCENIADSPHPILVTGETGVGKELIAQALHELGRQRGPFVPVNIAGVDANVFSDTLFGHCRGAFTGAVSSRSGLVEKAGSGTLFLDEIGDLNGESQIKLLRLVQEGEFTPLGTDSVRKSRARIIVATHMDLAAAMNAGTFRQDLFYRLLTHHIEIPPLRKRREDLEPLLDDFVRQAAAGLGKPVPSYPPELLDLLRHHPFPGNVRELKSMVMDAVSEHRRGKLPLAAFQRHILRRYAGTGTSSPDLSENKNRNNTEFSDPLPTLRAACESLIREAVHRAGGNQSIAAGMLGITQQALSQRLIRMRKRDHRQT
jgi:DNA-binding NtrC family response regulator